jgi:hypothetical protein
MRRIKEKRLPLQRNLKNCACYGIERSDDQYTIKQRKQEYEIEREQMDAG